MPDPANAGIALPDSTILMEQMPQGNFARRPHDAPPRITPARRWTRTFQGAAGCALLCLFSHALPAQTNALPEFRLGDTAASDLVAPVNLVVVDPERTAVLRLAEDKRVPPIFRYDPAVTDAVERDFRNAVDELRERFLDEVEAAFDRRKLSASALGQTKFSRLMAGFQKTYKSFPASTNLLLLWARGEPDEVLKEPLARALRGAMARYVRPDALPEPGRIGPWQVRLIPVQNPLSTLDAESAPKQGSLLNRSNLVALGRARSDFTRSLGDEELAFGKFAAAFLRENCVCDAALTLGVRALKTDPIFAADHYSAGQLIVKRGQPIDARIKAALDQLRPHLTVDQLKAQAAEEQRKAEAATAALKEQSAQQQFFTRMARQQSAWMLAGFGAVCLLLAFAVWNLARRRPAASLRPARVAPDHAPGVVIACPSCDEHIEIPTGMTVDVARPASGFNTGETGRRDALREKLLPHLARWLANKLVRGLITQRGHLLATQQEAAWKLAELERRLESIDAPWQERRAAYERRIAELEQALAARGVENRELLKAQILMARKKLQLEKAKDRLTWN